MGRRKSIYVSVPYRCNLVGRSTKRWSSEKYLSNTFFHLSNTWSCTSLHARTCSYISNNRNCWFVVDLYNSCVDLYNLCVAIFMLSYALHAMDGQAIAIYFRNPCLRRRITRVLYTSTRRAWTSLNILLRWCIFFRGARPLCPNFQGGYGPSAPPVPTPVLEFAPNFNVAITRFVLL